jgi:hypothetical protein
MPTKENIIEDVAQYSAEQLAEYIRQGIVSYDELCEEEDFPRKVRIRVKELIKSFEYKDWKSALERNTIEGYNEYLDRYPNGNFRDKALGAKTKLRAEAAMREAKEVWVNINKNNKVALEDYIGSYPDSPYRPQAQEALIRLKRRSYSKPAVALLKNEIENEVFPDDIVDLIKQYIDDNRISKDDFYLMINENPNLVTSYVVKKLVAQEYIEYAELEYNSGIERAFLEYIENNGGLTSPPFVVNAPEIESIKPKRTEIYFWGIPSSGKTCALGAILNAMRSGRCVDYAEPDPNCQGYEYLTKLSQNFQGHEEVFQLPMGTQTDSVYEMSYSLKNDKREYPVTFIDLSGETIHSMYQRSIKGSLSTAEERGLDMVQNLLKGNPGVNRKIHFFVVEYNGHTRKYRDLTQDTLLKGAMDYIKNAGVFNQETDAIYILVTKSDIIKTNTLEERNEALRVYINKYYGEFSRGLKDICTTKEINNGHVDCIPFTLGDVCFKNLCLLDSTTANTVVEMIMARAKSFDTSLWGKILELFEK